MSTRNYRIIFDEDNETTDYYFAVGVHENHEEHTPAYDTTERFWIRENGSTGVGAKHVLGRLWVHSTPYTGNGTITSSGTTVTGDGTEFTKQLMVGSEIWIDIFHEPYHKPDDWQKQIRRVDAINSDTSITINSPFSPDLTADSNYNYTVPILAVETTERVGIGTVSPTEKLDVNGRARIRELPQDNSLENFVVADSNGVLHKRDGSTVGSLQDLWETIESVDDSTSTTADSPTDTLYFDGWGIATVSITGDIVNITATEVDGDTTNELQNLWFNITSDDDGTYTTADLLQDTLHFDGLGIASISVDGDVVKINVTEVDGDTTNELQNLWETIESVDDSTSTIANSHTDTLYFDGYGVDVSISGDTVNISLDPSSVADDDWYEAGTTSPPDDITDDIYTHGKVGIGTTTPDVKLDVEVSSAPAATIGDSFCYASGSYAVAIGQNADAVGPCAFAVGKNAYANGNYAIAMCTNAEASGTEAIAIGRNSEATDSYAVSIGFQTIASGFNSLAMGSGSTASGTGSTAMGGLTTASGYVSTAMGYQTIASDSYSTALGQHTTSSGHISTAMGHNTTASGFYSTSTGTGTVASSYATTAMGLNITVQGMYSFGIGLDTAHSTITQANTMAIMGGKVGIGTVSPTEKLDVDGKARIRDLPLDNNLDDFVVADSTGVLHIRNGSTVGGQQDLWFNITSDDDSTYTTADDPQDTLHFDGYGIDVSISGDTVNISLDPSSVADDDWYEVGTTSPPDDITDDIYTHGKVGIDTVSPTEKLDVDGKVRIRDLPLDNNLDDFVVADSTGVLHIRNGSTVGGADHDWYEVGTTSPPDDITDDIYTNGNVGIGIATPTATLHVEPTVTSTADYTGIKNGIVYNGAGAMTNWYGLRVAAPTGSGTITNKYALVTAPGAGNVGIGTTSPDVRLDVEVTSAPAATIGDSSAYASGNYAVAIGMWAEATGLHSFAVGRNVYASEQFSIAMGENCIADDSWAIAMGKNNEATNSYAIALGVQTTASGFASTAMGDSSCASGIDSTAMGRLTNASGIISTAMGDQTTASDYYSTAMGQHTTSDGEASTAMGHNTTASGDYSTSMGTGTVASSFTTTAMGTNITVDGAYSFGIGLDTAHSTITQANTMAIMGGKVGIGTVAPLAKLHVDGGCVLATGTTGSTPISGAGTRLMWIPEKAALRAGTVSGTQWDNSNIGDYSVAMGEGTKATGISSVAMGYNTTATHGYSFAMGNGCTAANWWATAMGYETIASGGGSVALGRWSTASGLESIALGRENTASGQWSSVLGHGSLAIGMGSVAIGTSTAAGGWNSVAIAGGYAGGNWSVAIGGNTGGTRSIAIGGAISVSGEMSCGIGLDGYIHSLSQDNTMAIMGGNVGIGTVAPQTLLHIDGDVAFGAGGTLTISNETVTVTHSYHLIDESGGTGNLTTINGADVAGQLLIISAASGDIISVKDGTGNLQLAGSDFSMDDQDTITLIYNGTNWLELSRSEN